MDFDLNEDQIAFQDTARKFAEDELAPHAAKWDAEHIFPIDVIKKSGELGFCGLYAPEDDGGLGLSRLDSAIVFEALAEACPSTTAYITIHNMVTWMICTWGTDTVKSAWAADMCMGEKLGSYCLTEPGAGSDAASLKTKAVKVDGGYEISGSKAFISGAGSTDVLVVMARTGDDGAKGISAFVVPTDLDGISFGKPEEKMGWNSQPTRTITFDNVRVPAENLLGAEGEGFKIAMKGLNGGRINIAACSLGGARAAYKAAVEYVQDRKQFGKTIAGFQNTQFKLADMATDLDASQLMVYRAASSLDKGQPSAIKNCAMAKRFATDVCFDVVDRALQLFGGYGYIKEYPIERYLRDLRVHRILEGTNEIMRVIIARDLLKG
jgi:hypothetical protein